MNRTFLISTLTFVLGVAAGATIGILATKNKFEQKADAEILAAHKYAAKYFPVGKTKEELEAEKNEEPVPENSSPVDNTVKLTNTEEKEPSPKKIDYSKMYKPDDGEQVKKIVGTSSTTVDGLEKSREERKKRIYLISPQSFRESMYECKSLLYYSDGILADDDNNVIHTPSEVIGDEALDAFGRYEDDCVYVRDDNIQIDYEIIKDTRKFEDVLAQANKK